MQANYGLRDYECALADFNAVLQINSDNKAARQQLAIAGNKLREQHRKEKQTYAGMFEKLAAKDDAASQKCELADV